MLDTPQIRLPYPEIYDKAGGERQVIWHEDPNYESLFFKLMNDLKPKNFIETGTYKAGLLRWLIRYFPNLSIYSVEANKDFYDESCNWMRDNSNVHLTFGLSQDFLKDLKGSVLQDGLPFIYLDAHAINIPFPIPEEVQTISSLDRYICVIDDFLLKPELDYFVVDTESTFVWINHQTIKRFKDFEHPYVPNYKIRPPFGGYAAIVKGVDFEWPNYLVRI